MKNSIILGFFDGVHTAHKAVINSAVDFASNCGGKTILITFKQSPAFYFTGRAEYIYSREESLKKIGNLGVDEIVQLDFTKIADMPAEQYLEDLVQKYSPISISTGFNHTFGRNKGGTPDFLREKQKVYGFKYFCVPAQTYNGEVVSSTLIKKLLKAGEIEKADCMLGSNFILEGVVKKGARLGRELGFPTANIDYPENIVKIPYGVYKVIMDGRYGVLNWGMKPTVHNTASPVAEVHILDFNDDLYGKIIKIEVIKRIRGERKFAGLDELKAQINKDIEECLK